jgi:hypothetical protein
LTAQSRLGLVVLRALAAFVIAATSLAGCTGGDVPDAILPGVRTDTTVTDSFRCGELLMAAGCVIVRVPHVDSGCAPEVPGYVVCDATLEWTAETGAAAPQTRLSASVNGTDVGDSCTANPGAICQLGGSVNFTHRFTGPGQEHRWSVTIVARADAPGDPAPATGEFSLDVVMVVRTEERSAAEA